MMLAKVRRPSSTPSASTPRSGSSMIMSAAARATSVASSTDTPTSAARMAGASLIPSPMKPDGVTACLQRTDDAHLLVGRDAREQIDLVERGLASASSLSSSISAPGQHVAARQLQRLDQMPHDQRA